MQRAYPFLTEEYDGTLCTLTYRKAEDQAFVFRFTKEFETEILRVLGRMASHKKSGFTWDDAGKVSPFVRIELRKIPDILDERAIRAKLNRPA